ncbi:hypothetical protein HDU85_007380 [Gaertneriomyces sp. JEL0708]|nr:hypothetical protein HDU85_007380 [Gaertneriomyces sp. JEL0708]
MSLQDYIADVHDWRYEMRRDIQEILPGLWLGPWECSKNRALLKEKGITHVLCIRDKSERHFIKPKFPEDFIYEIIEVSESPLQNLIPYFPQATAFIGKALEQGGKVLVHCIGGISRSPSFVVAYVMMSQNVPFADAYQYVQNKRFCMNPNEGFKYQLKEYEPIYKANNDQHIQEYTDEEVLRQGRLKRVMQEDDDDEAAEEMSMGMS